MILDLVVSHNILSWALKGDEKAAKEGPPIRWVLEVRDPGGSGGPGGREGRAACFGATSLGAD